MIKVVVGRMDDNKVVEVDNITSISAAMSQGGFDHADDEVIRDIEGNEYNGVESAVAGKGYFLCSRVKSGK